MLICLCKCVCVWVCLCASEEKEDEERKVTEFIVHKAEREKNVQTKINKIINTHATVTVHICTVTVTIVHKCIIMHKLVWVFFCLNCVKVVNFFILYNYAQIDVIALNLYKSSVFLRWISCEVFGFSVGTGISILNLLGLLFRDFS